MKKTAETFFISFDNQSCEEFYEKNNVVEIEGFIWNSEYSTKSARTAKNLDPENCEV